MPEMDRRTFLAAAGATGASAALAAPADARRRRVRVTREEHRVVIVGSGFGGGVSALRLAQAGVRVLVLERGRWWPTGPNATTFPSVTNPDKRLLWYGSSPEVMGRRLSLAPYAGLLDATASPNMTALCAAGVGGGSLIYQGMTLQPSASVFAETFPEALDYARMDRVHYPRVARMLQVETAPDALIDSPTYAAARAFARNARAAGLPVEKIPMPIDWDYALAELRGEMKPSYTNGDGQLGVNNGGKHSVDVTYLKQAQATGRCRIAPLHHVTRVQRTKRGRWRITVDRTDEAGTVLEHKVITTKALIMAAGSLGTTKMLVRARERGDVADLPDAIGEGWGTNADRIYGWVSPADDFGGHGQGGPVIYGSKDWADPKRANTVIQASIPAVAGLDAKATVLVSFGVSPARGRFTYDGLRDEAVLQWRREADLPVQAAAFKRLAKIAGPLGVLVDTNLPLPTTWHALGGACMGTACDLEGRVRGQRGLYVLDGALMPGTTAACNPSMTIAAVAERALDDLVRRDVGRTI